MAAADPYMANATAADVLQANGAHLQPHTPGSELPATPEFGNSRVMSKSSTYGEAFGVSAISQDSKVLRVGRRSRPSIQVLNFDGPDGAKSSSASLDTSHLKLEEPRPVISGLAPAFEIGRTAPSDSSKDASQLNATARGLPSPYRSVTPLAQIAQPPSIERPASVLSDYSTSSSGSDNSTPGQYNDMFSNYGDTISPVTEAATPRGDSHGRKIATALTYGRHVPQVRPKKSKRIPVNFTSKMDQHLWNCMLKDMADFKNAPYRMSEGQPPPTGVQCRVATEAKRTWRGDVDDGLSGPRLTWPALKHTRARLRQLSRDQHRMTTADLRRMRACSPTPEQGVLDQLQGRQGLRELRRRRTYAYNMRDVRVTLFSQTAQSMRPGGPLNQLHTQSDSYFQNLAPWFENSHGGTRAGSDPFGAALQPAPSPLGAPFSHQAKTWTSGMARQFNNADLAQPQPQRPFATLNRLQGLEPAIDFGDRERQRGTNKRSAPPSYDDASPHDRQGHVDPFARADSSPGAGSSRRVRPRGLTLEDIFRPRTEAFRFGGDGTRDERLFNASTMPAPQVSSMGLGSAALRSPFDGIASRPTRARAVPRPAAALAIFSDAEPSSSIDARLASSLPGPSNSVTSTSMPKLLPFPPAIDGIDERDMDMDTTH